MSYLICHLQSVEGLHRKRVSCNTKTATGGCKWSLFVNKYLLLLLTNQNSTKWSFLLKCHYLTLPLRSVLLGLINALKKRRKKISSTKYTTISPNLRNNKIIKYLSCVPPTVTKSYIFVFEYLHYLGLVSAKGRLDDAKRKPCTCTCTCFEQYNTVDKMIMLLQFSKNVLQSPMFKLLHLSLTMGGSWLYLGNCAV